MDRHVLDETHPEGQYVFRNDGDTEGHGKEASNSGVRPKHRHGGRALRRGHTPSSPAVGLHLEPCKRTLPIVVVDNLEKVPTET
jgi:uncharacterized protein (TIGR03435 family)